MTDRELLEHAAKACGHDTSHSLNAKRLALEPPVDALCIPGISTSWNPLEDDGDAFRLAVKLEMLLDLSQHADVDGLSRYPLVAKAVCNDESDPLGASRRAIVMAAAQIGAGVR